MDRHTKVIFIPGNGGGSPKDNWFPSVKAVLEENGVKVFAREFPDNELARKSYWLPYLKNELQVDEHSILVGHSSGAIAALALAQEQKVLGSILVGAYHSDLGLETEKLSGYFDVPWEWENIRKNQQWTILFASQDDPWIPISEPRFIHQALNCEYHEFTNKGHFGGDYLKLQFPELTHCLLEKIHKR